MNRFKLCAIALATSLTLWQCGEEKRCDLQPVDYVNPNIGNISQLLVPTFPTVSLPNSMMRIYPMRDDFTTANLSGLSLMTSGHRRGSAISIIPQRGGEAKLPVQLSYDNEITRPYEYSVYLDDLMTEVKFAPSHQSALYEFIFEGNEDAQLIIPTDKGEISCNDNIISGYNRLPNGQSKIYLYGVFSSSIANSNNNTNALLLNFNEKNISLRYGVSFISVEQAKKNLNREILDFNIESVAANGRAIWNDALGKIQVEGEDLDDKEIFYTAMYRTYERPIAVSEDGQYYSAFDNQVHSDGGRTHYVDDWFWDTYRATHPLRLLIDQQTQSDIIQATIAQSDCKKEGEKWLTRFPNMLNGDSHGMNCNHGIISIWDAWVKGVRDFDLEKGYTAAKSAIEDKTLIPWSGAKAGELDAFYKEHGYFPALHEGEKEWVPYVGDFERRQAVAVTLGTSYDEWALGNIANALGKAEEAKHYLNCGLNYRNVFNPETKFFSPKDAKGDFIPDMDYRFDMGPGARDYYDENNGYTYRWSAQHNIEDLISLIGGDEAVCEGLDELFNTPLGMGKFNFWKEFGGDQTGNVGQFSMGNEPSFHIPYLYNYAGEPWKTQKMVKTLLDTWFRNDLMGIPGDEDGGGMSAFVIFSQMGFYPVTPGIPVYSIGTPTFEKVTMNMSNGNSFTVKANNVSSSNKYIQSATLNGKSLNRAWISHDELTAGGILSFEMGEKANKNWGLESNPQSGYSDL